jgi:hypothetical protein
VRRELDRDGVRVWLTRWGFAAAVAVAIAIGLLSGMTVHIPADIPSVALRAPALYRFEVGGAIFIGLYLVAMAFVLALQNRGFTEIGTGGIRATGLTSRSLSADQDSREALRRAIEVLKRRREEEGDGRVES